MGLEERHQLRQDPFLLPGFIPAQDATADGQEGEDPGTA